MPVLSDFTVVRSNDFFMRSSAETRSYSFNTGGRHNSNAVLDLALFGGYRNSTDKNMNIRVRINGTQVGYITVNRWLSHTTIVYDRINLVINPGILRSSGNNTLRLEPAWESANDYLFIGPIVCHFHQRD